MVDDFVPYINGISYDSKALEYTIVESLNEVPYFKLKLCDISTTDTNIVQGSWFALKKGSSYVTPKFYIEDVKKETDFFVECEGIDYVCHTLNRFHADLAGSYDTGSSKFRVQYSNKTPDQIVGWQLGLYSTGVTKGTCLSNSSDAINIRSENDKLLSFFYGIGKIANTDVYSSYSSDMSTNYINITSQGTDKSSTITLKVSGTGQNVNKIDRKLAKSELANHVFVLGRGDGINQLQSESFHATSTRSRLASSLSKTATSCTLEDASDFPSSGSVWIGCEKCTYTGKSGNTLTGLTRGVAFLGNVSEAYEHAVGSPVYDAQYTISSPQSTGSGSSINSNNEYQMSFEANDVIDQSTLDILAEKLLLERKGSGSNYDPPEIITIEPSDYVWAIENINLGDTIKIVDTDTGLNGNYRVVTRKIIYPMTDIPKVILECSNASYRLTKDIKKETHKGVVLSKYMQGATNIYQINDSDNCDSSHPLEVKFYIPEETIAINRVKINFKMEKFRAYSTTTSTTTSYVPDTVSIIPSFDFYGVSLPCIAYRSSRIFDVDTTDVVYDLSYSDYTITYPTSLTSAISSVKYPTALCVGDCGYEIDNFTEVTNSYIIKGYSNRKLSRITNVVSSEVVEDIDYQDTYPFTYDTPHYEAHQVPTQQSGSFYKTTFIIQIYNGYDSSRTFNWSLRLNSTTGTVLTSGSDSLNAFKGKTITYSTTTDYTGQWVYLVLSSPDFNSTSDHDTSKIRLSIYTYGKTNISHSHDIEYGIYEETLSSPSITVSIKKEGGSYNTVGTYTTDQNNVDITSHVDEANKWYTLKFTPNKRMRILNSTYVQIFINSR